MLARLLVVRWLLALPLPPRTPFELNCGTNQAYTASDGAVWQGDQYFTGGQQLYTGYPVANTPNPLLYRWTRQGYYGDFSYNIPVANGNYELTLKFAEIQYASPGSRIYNITINSVAVLTNFDVERSHRR
jgi:hypothetical protein